MPGGRPTGFRLGDRAELLAEFCLNTIAYTTRVPRQEDVGHDLFCVLTEVRDKLVWAGPSFTVQVKSDQKPLVFEKDHELAWIRGLENPFFLLIADLDELRIDIYSTWARLNGFMEKAANRVVLNPTQPEQGREQVWTADDGSEQVIYLDAPIISAGVREFIDKERANSLSRVLKQWIELDRENIVNCGAEMHWVLGPAQYQTNDELDPDRRWCGIYWNKKNLDRCQTNFGRAATELRLTLRAALGPEGEHTGNHTDRIAALDEVIRAYWQCLDPLSQYALKEHVGLAFGDE